MFKGAVRRLPRPDDKSVIGPLFDGALFELFDTVFGLLAIGTRASGLRAEIAKVLVSARLRARTPEAERLREGAPVGVDAVCRYAAEILTGADDENERVRTELGRHLVGDLAAQLPGDVHEELVRTLPLMSWQDGLTTGARVLVSLHLIAAAGRGAPEQFYLPASLAGPLYRPWTPDHTRAVLAPLAATERAQRPAQRRSTVGPNEPCSCGSGRKWKRCCGAT